MADEPTTPDTPTSTPITPPSTPPSQAANQTTVNTPVAPGTPPTGGPQKAPASHKKLVVSFVAIVGSVVLIAGGVVGGIVALRHFAPNASPSLTSGVDGNTTITAEESSIATVAEKVGPSVVSIVAETSSQSLFSSGAASGTGIIVSNDGYILTNNHVVENARSVSIVDSNGEQYDDVEIIGRDPLNDIAFLKVTADKSFTAASLGNSSTIRTGQQVVAIGNALGQYSNTVTSGIISGTGRPITAENGSGDTETLTDLIQTDASINPGNSGGPLVNMAGQVIGINTAIVEDANGIGFAIPINAAKGVLAEVLETGQANRSYLGVNYLTVTPGVAREYDLSVNAGAYVYASESNPVAPGSPAAQAGIRNGDVITKINDSSLGTQGSLSSILGEYRPGDKVTLTYVRDGTEATASVVLGTYSE